MRSFQPKTAKHSLGEQAGEWLLNLEDREPGEDHPYPDPAQRQEAFFKWVSTSPDHARVFLETVETWRRLACIDSRRAIEIQALLEDRGAEVIHLFESTDLPARKPRRFSFWRAQQLMPGAIAAAGLAAIALIALFVHGLRPHAYSTAVGEHQTHRLDDGSIIHLNTASKVTVDFSSAHRRLELLEGEALFVVARDAQRPFTVRTGDALIRALGTQFNVRQRARTTDVTVVEGAVQVTAEDAGLRTPPLPRTGLPASAPSPVARAATAVILDAGEAAKVTGGAVRKNVAAAAADTVSWREWRLVFRDTPLAVVAEEFNRYNRNQIIIEGAAARAKQMTGVFDADLPDSLIAYTAKDETLTVRSEGENWIISAR